MRPPHSQSPTDTARQASANALESADPLAVAMAGGVTVKQDLLLKAGGELTSTQVAQALGITRQGVYKRRARGSLLAMPSGSGDYLYPACQFTETGVIDHLDEVLKGMRVESPWMRLSFLLSPAPALGGRTVLEALTVDDIAKSLSLAAAFGEQGA